MARAELDFYPTPTKLTKALLNRVEIAGSILEPCAGDGAISNLFKANGYHVITNDIDPRHQCNHTLDASVPLSWMLLPRTDWIITNPPYGKAVNQIVPLAWEHCRVGMAMLLRGNWYEACSSRFKFWVASSPYLAQIVQFESRDSFTGDGKPDKVGVYWFVYRKNNRDNTRWIQVEKEAEF